MKTSITPSVLPLQSSLAPQGKRLAWVLGLSSLALLVALGAYLSPLHPHILALQFTFDQASFQAILAAWKPEGVLRYRAHLPIDCGLLLCYGAFGYVVASQTALFAHFSPIAAGLLRWIVPAAAFCDAVENALHWRLTSGAPPAEPVLYWIAGTSATLKCALLAVFLLAVVLARTRPARASA